MLTNSRFYHDFGEIEFIYSFEIKSTRKKCKRMIRSLESYTLLHIILDFSYERREARIHTEQ